MHFLCLLLDASLNISTTHFTSTPSTFEVILPLTHYTNYLLTYPFCVVVVALGECRRQQFLLDASVLSTVEINQPSDQSIINHKSVQ